MMLLTGGRLQSQLDNSNRSFGQGAGGYGRYFGTAYGDLFIGDYMSEAVFPILLHQDPRYFRRGSGTGRSRLGYAVKEIFITHNDSGRVQFNYSEILGNSVAVAISNAYYSDNRTARNGASNLGIQLGVDAVGNILTEFWPYARWQRFDYSNTQAIVLKSESERRTKEGDTGSSLM
jgi:hypothetical protein